MNTTWHSPDSTWWGLKGPDVPLDRTAVVTKKVRKYTYRNTFYTVLACASINDPDKICYLLEISRLIGTETKSTETKDFSIIKELLREFPIPLEGYEIAEEKLRRKIENRMLNILADKIKSLETETAEASIPCKKPAKKNKKVRQKNHRKATQDKKVLADSHTHVQPSAEQRINSNKDATKNEKTRLKQTEVIQDITTTETDELTGIRKDMTTGISSVALEEPRHSWAAIASNAIIHFEPELGDKAALVTQQTLRERLFNMSTYDKVAVQKLLEMVLSNNKHQRHLKIKLVGNNDNVLVKVDTRKRERMFGFYVDVNLDTLYVEYDITKTYVSLFTHLAKLVQINDTIRATVAILRYNDNIQQSIVPVNFRDRPLQLMNVTPGNTGYHRRNVEESLSQSTTNEVDMVRLSSEENVTDSTSDVIDDITDHDECTNEYYDDDDDGGFMGGIMGVYCRSGIHLDYSENSDGG